MIFSEKCSEKPTNLTIRDLYDCLLVAIAMLYYLCKFYAGTGKLCGSENFILVFLKYIDTHTWLIFPNLVTNVI